MVRPSASTTISSSATGEAMVTLNRNARSAYRVSASR
jgi:hypothetical protein